MPLDKWGVYPSNSSTFHRQRPPARGNVWLCNQYINSRAQVTFSTRTLRRNEYSIPKGQKEQTKHKTLQYLVVVAISFAVLIEDERDADQKRPEQERHQLARLRPKHGAGPLLAERVAHHHGLGEKLGEGDEDEGPGADQQDDGDVRAGHGAAQREDDDRAEDGRQG